MPSVTFTPPHPVKGDDVPEGFPAYCILFESGMPTAAETKLKSVLKIWGNRIGANAYVARWDIGDPSYADQVRYLGLDRVPAIVLSDKAITRKGADLRSALLVRLDNPDLLGDLSKVEQLLPLIVNRILRGDSKDAAKDAIRTQKAERLAGLLGRIAVALKGVKISFGFAGASIEVEL